MVARKKSLSVYMAPFVRQTLDEHMPVDEGLKFLHEKAKMFNPYALSYAKEKRRDI